MTPSFQVLLSFAQRLALILSTLSSFRRRLLARWSELGRCFSYLWDNSLLTLKKCHAALSSAAMQPSEPAVNGPFLHLAVGKGIWERSTDVGPEACEVVTVSSG